MVRIETETEIEQRIKFGQDEHRQKQNKDKKDMQFKRGVPLKEELCKTMCYQYCCVFLSDLSIIHLKPRINLWIFIKIKCYEI